MKTTEREQNLKLMRWASLFSDQRSRKIILEAFHEDKAAGTING
jgi:hypothetical protein